MADALTGAAGFLQGLNSQLGPFLDQQIATQAQAQAVQATQLKGALRKKIETLKATNRFDLDDPLHQQAAAYAYSIGGKLPKGVENFLSIPDVPPQVSDAVSGMIGTGGGEDGAAFVSQLPGGLGVDPQTGSAVGRPSTTQTGNGFTSVPEQQSLTPPLRPPLRPPLEPEFGRGPAIDAAPMTADPSLIVPPIESQYGTRTPTPGKKAPRAGGGLDLKPGQSISVRLAPGFTINMSGQSVTARNKQQLQQAYNRVRDGENFSEVMAELPGDLALEFAQQLATRERDQIVAAGGDYDAASQRVFEKYGETPEGFAELRKQESLMRERVQLETDAAGPRADARNESALKYAGPIARERANVRLETEPPIAEATEAARLGVRAELDPNARQQAGTILGIDMTKKVSAVDEARIEGYLLGKQERAITGEETARQAVNPQPGFLAQQAAAEAAGGPPSATAVLEGQKDRAVAETKAKAEAAVDVEAEKPLEKPALWRDPVTLQPADASTSTKQARAKGFVKIDEKDTTTVVNLGRLEDVLVRYKKLVPQLYPTNNAFANKLNFARNKAAGSALITEYESFLPELTVLSRASGERGQSTNQDIGRAAAGLAKGTEFATQAGVRKAIANTEASIAKVRKTMGFKPRAGDVGSEVTTDDGIIIRRKQ